MMGRRRIHVVHVLPTLTPGGMELAMCRVVAGLEGMRHSVIGLHGEASIANRLPAGTDIHCLRARPNEPLLPWRLGRLLRQLDPNVIHARNWTAWPDTAAARLLAVPHARLIWSFHGLETLGPLPARRRVAMRLLATLTSRLFTVSSASRRYLIGLGLPAGRICVIPNGVDTGRFRPHARPADTRIVIGSAGSLKGVKNHALLIRACAEMAHGGADLELRLAGAGPLRQELESLAASLGLAERLKLPGQVENVPAFLAGLDIFALPSHSEGHPNALLEAMSCGLACVATDVGGVGEVLQAAAKPFGGEPLRAERPSASSVVQSPCGHLVLPGDLQALTAALAELTGDASLRRRLGQAARERVTSAYSMPAMLAAYERLYRDPTGFPAPPACEKRTCRRTVLMLCPLPPLMGGMAAVGELLRTSRLARGPEGCRLSCINNGKTTPAGRPTWQGLWAQLRLLGELSVRIIGGGVQILHIHTCSGLSFWRDSAHLLLGRALGCRCVLHVHGGRFHEFLAGLHYLARPAARWALLASDAVIVLSRQARGQLAQFCPSARWQVIPNGVELPEEPPPAQPPARHFLYLGDLARTKGVDDLIAAADRAFAAGLDGTLSMAGGESAPGDRMRLEAKIQLSSQPSRIRLLGVVIGQAKQQALSAADVLVLPSHAEGMPMSLLEAMALGKPVIASCVGGIPEMVSDGIEGFLIQPGDVQGLAERMLWMNGQEELYKRMSLAARDRVARQFSLDGMVLSISLLYDRVMNEEHSL